MLSDRCPVLSVLWPNGCMDQDATWYGGRPRPRPHCVVWRPSSHHGKGHSSPNFRPMSTVVKRSTISAASELLFFTYLCINLWNNRHRFDLRRAMARCFCDIICYYACENFCFIARILYLICLTLISDIWHLLVHGQVTSIFV